jgi:acyl-CoA reductase-like NAD-dependent aldehyde dehydrogenase
VSELDPDLRALQEVRDRMRRAKAALGVLKGYGQAEIDRVCATMARAGAAAAADLARLTVEETGIGRVHYKILKNLFGSEGTWESIKDEQTVGVLRRDDRQGMVEIATPAGIVAGIVPTTNPVCTATFKALIAVKGRNTIVISPHPRARRCIREAVEVLRRAAERAGAPADIVQCLANPTLSSTAALMEHRDTAVILATGGEGLVKAAYSSGRPAYGVGPGNVPVYIDRSADLARAARSIIASQSFDNATLCSSEQALVLDQPVARKMLAELAARGAHLCEPAEVDLLAAYCNRGGMMNADLVGQDPWKVARAAGFEVPHATTVLLAPQGGVGRDWPLSIEILCPLLSVHEVDGWEEGCEVCTATLKFGGLGHTLGIHANDQDVLDAFFLQKPASRILANGPTSMGAVGYSSGLVPSMSLGCGPQAGNISSDNISARHLINIKRVAYPLRDWVETERADHARAATLGGERAPRGSGLPGDPGLAAAQAGASPRRASSPNTSRGQGARGEATSSRSKVHRAPKAAAAAPPSFTRPVSAIVAPAPTVSAPPAGTATLARSATIAPGGSAARGHEPVGSSLSTGEIEAILSHAGSGCPMGPCKGCPHHEVPSGSCTA